MNASDPRRQASLRRDLSHSVGASAIYALAQWAVVVVVAQLGDARQVGLVTLAAALVTPIFAFSSLSLREARTVDVSDRFSVADYYALRMSTAAAASALCVIILWATYGFAPFDLAFAVLASMVARILYTQTNLNYGIFQNAGRFDLVAKSSYLRSAVGIAGFGVTFWATRSVGWAYLAQAATWALTFTLYESPKLAALGHSGRLQAVRQVSPRVLWQLFTWILPLGLAGAFQTLTAAAPRFALSHSADLQTLGYFGAIAYFQSASQVVTTAVGQAAVRRLSRRHQDGDRWRFVALSLQLLALNAGLGGVIVALAWLVGPAVVSVLYGPDYVNPTLILQVAGSVALAFCTSVFQTGLSAGQFFGSRLTTNLVTFCLACLLSVLLIPSQGIAGAGWVLFASAAFRLLLSVVAWTRALAHIG